MTYYIGKRDKNKQSISRFILRWAKKIKLIKMCGGKCKKCGISNLETPWIYQFHHKDNTNKEYAINKVNGLSFSKMKKELKKCICVCENCHREIHSEEATVNKSTVHKLLFLDYKKTNKCEKCNYNKCIKSLDFHHIGNKDIELADLITKSTTKVVELRKIIENELDKCVVLCSNCHRGVHSDNEKFQKYKSEIFKKSETLEDNYANIVDHTKVINLNKKGYTQKEISKILGCGLSTVCGILKANNIHKFRIHRDLDAKKIIDLRSQGKKNPEIAKIIGCNRFSIAGIIKRHKNKNT